MGIAPCLESDLETLQMTAGGVLFDYMAIGVDCSDRVCFDIQHVASYHTSEFEIFKTRRKKIGGNLDYKTHSHEGNVDYVWSLVDKSPYSGSSSFLGAQAAVGMGYDRIVLCGCPMQGNNNSKSKAKYERFQVGWKKYGHLLQGKVRSMSGWTKEYFGPATKEWLLNE
jgi:hypothetical protein